jgi:hypothetical protein
MVDKTFAISEHKLLQIVITEEPVFHCEVFQHFGTFSQDNTTPTKFDCRVMTGLNEMEFNLVAKTMLDYLIEKRKKSEEVVENTETGDLIGDA